MKKTLLIISVALLAMACNQTKTYTVSGNIEGLTGNVNLRDNNEQIIAETESTDGTFTLNVKSDVPVIATLRADKKGLCVVFLEDGKVTVSGKLDDRQSIKAEGSASNDAYNVYTAEFTKIADGIRGGNLSDVELEAAYSAIDSLTDSNYEQNKNNLWGAYVLVSQKIYELDPDQILETVAGFPKKLQNTIELKRASEQAIAMKKTAVGQPYTDVTMADADGKDVALSSLVGEGKVVLLDFWASWCGPCMGEAPYLTAAYKEYHDKGFEIYGISLDSDRTSWLNAIKEKGFDWTNVSVLGGWNNDAAKEYSVNSIPSNFLIDGQGIIVARNLRGEALAAKLAELLK